MLRLQQRSLEWAITHASAHGDTDVFPAPLEIQAVLSDRRNVVDYLCNQDVLQWRVRPPRRCLVPKHRYGFRPTTQLDLLDFLVLTALVFEAGAEIEQHRVPSRDRTVFSHRYAPTAQGEMFDPSIGFAQFQERSREIVQIGGFSHVVVADIADFYPRIYAHRLENALQTAVASANHSKGIIGLLKQWNERVSYGIPVGSDAASLLAEIAINDIDRSLLSENVTYVRYTDDFRVFCRDEKEAHARLAFLADGLFEAHGLTLQQYKTKIVSLAEFTQEYLELPEQAERRSLSERFAEFADQLGLTNSYQAIEYDDLSPDQQRTVDSFNLNDILRDQLANDELDIPLTGFVLRRLGQLADARPVDAIFGAVDRLYPVFKDVMRYFSRLRHASEARKAEIGRRILGLLDTSMLSHLDFHRMWILSLFTTGSEWDNEQSFIQLYSRLSDEWSQRELILAIGRAGHDHWFRRRKREVFNLSPWTRRAFLAAASCLPRDEREHWYRSLEPRLDPLESAIVKWARESPFG